MSTPLVAPLLILFTISLVVSGNALCIDYYAKTCPDAELAVTEVVKKAIANDNTVPAALLRLHFHDCFIRGCDASVLLKSRGSDKAEKDGPPNESLHAFYVIDHAKKAVEEMCPGVVSCADILALAARDSVALSGGPTWEVPKGRKDGRFSRANETNQLPAPTFNFTQLKQSFSQRGLSTKDLVVLSGGHTLGFAHCSSFQNRIHDFDTESDVDPTLDPSFAARLQEICPAQNRVKSAGSAMDSTSTVFDNTYYKMLLQGQGLFSSDEALLTHPKTAGFVSQFASSQEEFFQAFVKSIIRMGSIEGGEEVRKNCRAIN
ncbi:peroxidase 64-like [Zingiber officinale]|uniref:peroxidase 64-like n=1 Tax=Zingiber officinale TaxID=94328 RepID=UPI001C4AB1FF|nr:peroxidase 64-like [Zingiber officinale]